MPVGLTFASIASAPAEVGVRWLVVAGFNAGGAGGRAVRVGPYVGCGASVSDARE